MLSYIWETEWGKSTLRQVHPAKTQIILGSVTTDQALFCNQKLLIFFLFLRENICCGYSLEAPHGGASNEYPQHMFSRRNIENIYMMTLLTGAIHIFRCLIWAFCIGVLLLYDNGSENGQQRPWLNFADANIWHAPFLALFIIYSWVAWTSIVLISVFAPSCR